MEIFPVRATQPPWENNNFQNKRKKNQVEEKKPLKRSKENKGKVIDLVLEHLANHRNPLKSSLLASATAPHVVLDFVSELPIQNKEKSNFDLKKAKMTGASSSKSVLPIGISSCEYNGWINALMQFIIFIPSLSEMFAYTPKSLSPFIEFIEQYKKDQAQNKSVTSASSLKLLESIRKKILLRSSSLSKDPAHFFTEIVRLLMKSMTVDSVHHQDCEEVDLLALRPDWIIPINPKLLENFTWEEIVERHFQSLGIFEKADKNLFFPFPKELLISFTEFSSHKEKSRSDIFFDKIYPKKQFFVSYNRAPCALYELDVFVEFRANDSEKGDYITYVKVEGEWRQCDDNRITLLRPINLSIPLRRSFLFHYRKLSH